MHGRELERDEARGGMTQKRARVHTARAGVRGGEGRLAVEKAANQRMFIGTCERMNCSQLCRPVRPCESRSRESLMQPVARLTLSMLPFTMMLAKATQLSGASHGHLSWPWVWPSTDSTSVPASMASAARALRAMAWST